MGLYELEERRLAEEVRRRGAKRVVIQLPEGLKGFAERLASVVEDAGAMAMVIVDPCYGACGIALEEARELEADLIVHYGHTQMVFSGSIPAVYMEARMKLDLDGLLEEALDMLSGFHSVGISTTLQHIHLLERLREFLEKRGVNVFVGRGTKARYPGQVVGCDYGALRSVEDRVDGFLFLGGRFHGLGAQLSTSKPVLVVDPYERRVYSLRREAERVVKRRWASIVEAQGAESFGVLVGLMPGQRRIRMALEIRRFLEESGRRTTLLVAKYITPEGLADFTMDAFVNTACPRVSIDDSLRFRRPLLLPGEVLVMLGRLGWESLCNGGWFEERI